MRSRREPYPIAPGGVPPGDDRHILRYMTDADGVLEGGLDEPADLQPAEGSLRLVGDDDSYDVAAWEAATATVLRKARRLGEDAPDSDVWSALTRTTLDGIDVAPIGQPSDLDDLVTGGRPQRVGAWDDAATRP